MMVITFDLVITGIVALSVVAVFSSIAVDFILFESRSEVKKQKKSIVATGTMVMFFMLYILVIRSEIGRFTPVKLVILRTLQSVGAFCVAAGAVINILGRFSLKRNWSNHIKIYEDQSLVTSGVYHLVRHPLYASLMLMLLGGAVVYTNYLCAILTLVIFIPFMYYRAKQEEVFLIREFNTYEAYREKTGMFFPEFWRR
jgi:protein-S-isoprenylcysteine O-methyltransferase Ste14